MPSPEIDLSTLVILLSVCAGLLTLILLVMLQMSSRLARMEKPKFQNESSHSQTIPEIGPSSLETSAGGAFELFLSEDPSRRKLAKGEQLSAYRKWRQEKGMNWSNS